MFKGDECSDFPEIKRATHSVPDVTWHNDVIHVTCHQGYEIDGETEAEMRCNETHQWEPDITQCTGKHISYLS